jgi:hypothetical protein
VAALHPLDTDPALPTRWADPPTDYAITSDGSSLWSAPRSPPPSRRWSWTDRTPCPGGCSPGGPRRTSWAPRERVERAAGATLRAIAERLTADGVATARDGATWSTSSVQAVLAGQDAARFGDAA